MIYNYPISAQTPLRQAITEAYRADETQCVNELVSEASFSPDVLQHIQQQAEKLIIETRKQRKAKGGLDAFLHKYDLSSEEGIALLCLAEALLRIPDTLTIDRLISDKISPADWKQHLNKEDSLFVNAATWSLLLTGKVFAPTSQTQLSSSLTRLLSRLGGTLIRPIILQGMKIIGKQFVMGRTIEEALKRAKSLEKKGYRYSYDMLGEAARTEEDAARYFKAYEEAIIAVGKTADGLNPITGPGVSIKLSALHPRYEFSQRERVIKELIPRLLQLAKIAKEYHIGMVIDAEEADRLELSLEIIEAVFTDSSLSGWEGFGLAVQSYQKRAPFVIDWLVELSKRHKKRFMIRLIKGAYWDSEIKQSQLLGLSGYPVFTRKNSTDVSFIACAKKILAHPDCFYPQFGTHNAYSVAALLHLLQGNRDFEFQCLHGMGEPLYDQIVAEQLPCRIYAPVGNHKELLGYLVRRLLENGANTSFINRIADDDIPLEKIIIDPVARIQALPKKPHPHIPLPQHIFGAERLNSIGIDLTDHNALNFLQIGMEKADKTLWDAGSIINGKKTTGEKIPVVSPSSTEKIIGYYTKATALQLDDALKSAMIGKVAWAKTSLAYRAACLERAADLFEKHIADCMTLLCREGGKAIPDCLSEVRETIDYCRYYAALGQKTLAPQLLTGPTGEYNQLSLHPRGIITCISPWNFPLAIFSGQILAALMTGNAVIAKPAEQTPLIAAFAIQLLHTAGIPKNVLHLLLGEGSVIGTQLVADERVDGVMFTGSTEVAKHIQRALANREGPIVPFIAETGGQNAMIVDSSALLEQVVVDVITSAFNSAGQRCSALRLLFIQEDIATPFMTMLKNTMRDIVIGDPSLLKTDVGPVIDQEAHAMLQKHFEAMQKNATLLYQVPLPEKNTGYFFAPAAFELKNSDLLTREIFGPILHIVRFAAKNIDQVLESIIKTGYGLTQGIHSRIEATVDYVTDRLPVGNTYVNRNMIGAQVGVQPFGGEGLSGTGPKAGGPHYLSRLCVERSLSINTTAAGGNATLVSLSEEE